MKTWHMVLLAAGAYLGYRAITKPSAPVNLTPLPMPAYVPGYDRAQAAAVMAARSMFEQSVLEAGDGVIYDMNGNPTVLARNQAVVYGKDGTPGVVTYDVGGS